MSRCDKLLRKAENSPNNFSFTEICQLAECFGFEFQRQSGSHVIYQHPTLTMEKNCLMNFQNVNGKAKPYQIKQLLKAISFLRNE